MSQVQLVPPTLKVTLLLGDGADHQNVKVPGPVTTVCRMLVCDPEVTVPLIAAETPSCETNVWPDHGLDPGVQVVVHVRFVAFRAFPNIWEFANVGKKTAKAVRLLRHRRCTELSLVSGAIMGE
jgi:hypothetical protein